MTRHTHGPVISITAILPTSSSLAACHAHRCLVWYVVGVVYGVLWWYVVGVVCGVLWWYVVGVVYGVLWWYVVGVVCGVLWWYEVGVVCGVLWWYLVGVVYGVLWWYLVEVLCVVCCVLYIKSCVLCALWHVLSLRSYIPDVLHAAYM